MEKQEFQLDNVISNLRSKCRLHVLTGILLFATSLLAIYRGFSIVSWGCGMFLYREFSRAWQAYLTASLLMPDKEEDGKQKEE